MVDQASSGARASTGVSGLDAILMGGLERQQLYLVEGTPGSGKTALALHFLMEGARRGEKCLYITLSETERELRRVAEGHGWSLEGITIFELIPLEPMIWVTRERPEVSLNASLALRVAP